MRTPPSYPETMPPKLIQLIIKAYMVPSMLLGHILQAITSKGIVFNSPTTYIMILSLRQKILSGICKFMLYRVTSIICESESRKHKNVVTVNYFLNSTFLRYLLYIRTESIDPSAYMKRRRPRNSGEKPK